MAGVQGSGFAADTLGPPPGWPWKRGMAALGSIFISGTISKPPRSMVILPLVPKNSSEAARGVPQLASRWDQEADQVPKS